MTHTPPNPHPEQVDRIAAADLLDEISSLLDHNGIGQVADLIRDGEYDEHAAVAAFVSHRIASLAKRPADDGEVAIWSGEHQAYWRKGADGSGAGYTTDTKVAGQWPRHAAVRLTGGCGPEKLIALHVRPSLPPQPEGVKRSSECPSSPDGRHQVDTSMESGPNNCFHCEGAM